jgi:puromycin-sensitive aminopeptidase
LSGFYSLTHQEFEMAGKYNFKCACHHASTKPHRNKFRLPRNVVPSHYDLHVKADPDSTTFSGSVSITVNVLEPTPTISINAKRLQISSASIVANNAKRRFADVIINENTEIACLTFTQPVEAGKYILDLEFTGVTRTDSQGLFRATWKDKEKTTHTMLCTQFESADARCVFPCFDEPDFKATFATRLTVPQNMTALSNGDICSTTLNDDSTKTVCFSTPPKMSTYVVAFTIGELTCSEARIVNGTRLQIWTVPGRENKTEHGLNAAAFGLNYFENYFKRPYAFGNKIDLLAVPGYAWGGMENPGLIVFQDTFLLIQKPGLHLDFGLYVIMHELAHQWFGNLVTMRWWNGLWLNESFATLMGMKATNAYFPHWNVWTRFSTDRERAYTCDGVAHTHAMEESVMRPSDAAFLVDPISYDKGCAVLYQTEQFIGETVFEEGIRDYMSRHEFANTESFDLWDSLEKACLAGGLDLPIRAVMDGWIFKKGHPEVIVTESSRPGFVNLEQRIFRVASSDKPPRTLWPIPLTVTVKDAQGHETSEKFLFSKRSMTVRVGRDFQWVKLNADGSGFYRVRYAQPLLDKLTANITSLSDIEQWNLLFDAQAFFQSCAWDATQLLATLFKFARVNDAGSWQQIGEGMQMLDSLAPPEIRPRLLRLVKRELKQAFEYHQWNMEESTALPFLQEWKPYHLNHNPRIQKFSEIFLKDWMRDPNSIEPFMAGQAAMILHCGKRKMPQAFRDLQLQSKGTGGLQIQRYLIELARRLTEAGKKITPLDLFAEVLTHNFKRKYSVDTFERQWVELLRNGNPAQIMNAIRYQLQDVDTVEDEQRLKALFKKYPYRPCKMEIARLMDRVLARVLVRERQPQTIAMALATRSKTARKQAVKKAA